MLASLQILIGLIALVIGAEFLVRGASRLATSFGISPLVVGLTVVAFGTSAPELAVSISSALSGRADIAVGNILGSNIYNVLFILGLSAVIVPLVVDQKLVRFDVPVMIAVSLLMWFFGRNGVIDRTEGGLLFAGLVAYTVWCIIAGRRESAAVASEYKAAFGSPESEAAATTEDAAPSHGGTLRQLGLVAVGLLLLVVGANWLVEGATTIARHFGISELVIGLTVVALGTSLPELATSVVAALRGERDIAVGNVVGSNLFNILCVLGLSALIAPRGVAVADQALRFDIPVMVAVAIACLPLFFTGHLLARWEGALFLAYGVAYTLAIFLMATESQTLPQFQLLMVGFVIPLTVITILVTTTRAIAQRRVPHADGDSLQ